MKWVLGIVFPLNAILFVADHNWCAILWMVCAYIYIYALTRSDRHIADCHGIIKDQSDYIEEADNHIQYLTQHDTWKQIRQAKTEARVSAANCYRYLQRIGQLKVENEQLKILNRNLLRNQGKGVKNYARNTKR